MKLPTFEQAASAISALSGIGPSVTAAASLVKTVIDLFDDKPEQQEQLKAMVPDALKGAYDALDRLDDAIKDAEKDA